MLLLSVIAAGCARASSRVTVVPDGQWAYAVACKEADACMAEAQRLCPKGYQTLGAGEQYDGATAQTFGNQYSAVTRVRSTSHLETTVRCRGGELGGRPTD